MSFKRKFSSIDYDEEKMVCPYRHDSKHIKIAKTQLRMLKKLKPPMKVEEFREFAKKEIEKRAKRCSFDLLEMLKFIYIKPVMNGFRPSLMPGGMLKLSKKYSRKTIYNRMSRIRELFKEWLPENMRKYEFEFIEDCLEDYRLWRAQKTRGYYGCTKLLNDLVDDKNVGTIMTKFKFKEKYPEFCDNCERPYKEYVELKKKIDEVKMKLLSKIEIPQQVLDDMEKIKFK